VCHGTGSALIHGVSALLGMEAAQSLMPGRKIFLPVGSRVTEEVIIKCGGVESEHDSSET